MPHRFYAVERPRAEEKLPDVLSKEEILGIIDDTNNIKHRCIVSLLYSVGLRRGEVLNLKVEDIDSRRMAIKVPVRGTKTVTLFFLKSFLEILEIGRASCRERV